MTPAVENPDMHRHEMIQALLHAKPSRFVPIWELEFHIWDKFADKAFCAGEEFVKLTSLEKDRAVEINAEIMAGVSEKLHFAAVTIPGSCWEVAPGVPSYYWLPWEYRVAQARALTRLLDKKVLLVANTGGVIGMPSADNYIEFSYKLFDAPEQIDRMAEESIRKGIERMKLFADLGVRAVFTGSDLADNRGPFFNDAQMERFVYPHMRQYADAAKALDIFPIVHTDGAIGNLIGGLRRNGVSALQGFDTVAGMDIRKVQRQHSGALTVCGNIDCGLLLTGTPGAVFEATAALLEKCKHDGGFVLGASNAVQREVPRENYQAVIEAWKRHGQTEAGVNCTLRTTI